MDILPEDIDSEGDTYREWSSARPGGRRPKFRAWLLGHTSLIKKSGVVLLVVLVIYGAYRAILRRPSYPPQATLTRGQHFDELVNSTGEYRDTLRAAMDIIKQYDSYYAKVANNLDGIFFEKRCHYMCVSHSVDTNEPGNFLVSPPYQDTLPVYINPDGLRSYKSSYDVAAALIHESDHAEFLRSSRLRKLALVVHCNVVTNFRISVDSALPDLTHRFSPMEICAQREEIAFHKLTETESGYEFKRGMIYNFSRVIKSTLKLFGQILAAIF